MTQHRDALKRVNKMVVSLDICSSSRILEDLIETDNLQPLADVTMEMKEIISAMADQRNAYVYKFTGDGWIVLFDEPYSAIGIAEFITGASAMYRHCYDNKIKPVLNSPPEVCGLKFGIDDGVLLKLSMDKKDEYIGRSINVACRLQGLVTDTDMTDGCQALISSRSYEKIDHALDEFSPIETRRSLKNIAGDEGLSCYKLAIPKKASDHARQAIGDWLKHFYIPYNSQVVH